MTDKHKELGEKLQNLINIQRDCLCDEYMRGMLNGLLVAWSVVSGEEPEFEPAPKNEALSAPQEGKLELDELKEQIETLKANLAGNMCAYCWEKMHDAGYDLVKERDKLKARVSELESENKRLNEVAIEADDKRWAEFNRMESENARLSARIAELESIVNTKQFALDRERARIAELEGKKTAHPTSYLNAQMHIMNESSKEEKKK